MASQEFQLTFQSNIIDYWALFFSGIGYNLSFESPSTFNVAIRLKLGEFPTILAVANGEADVGLTTPPVCATMGYRGVGPFSRKMENLRAIGSLPHDDRMVWAVPADSGINSVEEMREHPLRLVIPGRDFPVRFAAEKVLEACGTSLDDLKNCGWQILEESHCQKIPVRVLEGKADAIIHEAYISPPWRQVTQTHAMKFLPVRDDILKMMENEYGYRRGIAAKGTLRGIDNDIPCVDFSNFLMFVRNDMPDDLAYRLTATIVEKRESLFEVHVRATGSNFVVYPIKPAQMCRNIGGIPLHPAAERYYKEHGYM